MDGINGLLANCQSEWVDKLSILIKDFNMRVRMGVKGRKAVVERFTLELNAGKWLEILKQFDKTV